MKLLISVCCAAGLCALALASGASSPPRDTGDLCVIFEDHPGWFDAAVGAEERWGVPVHVSMAFIRQESSFRARAKPPRERLLGFIPGPRPSTAFGYAQAVDGTWEQYKRATGRGTARRTRFSDAVDFIGWYNHNSRVASGLARDDAYHLYLAYHEGHAGFDQKSWRAKPWLIGVSLRVQADAERYRSQFERCRSGLERPWFGRLLA